MFRFDIQVCPAYRIYIHIYSEMFRGPAENVKSEYERKGHRRSSEVAPTQGTFFIDITTTYTASVSAASLGLVKPPANHMERISHTCVSTSLMLMVKSFPIPRGPHACPRMLPDLFISSYPASG